MTPPLTRRQLLAGAGCGAAAAFLTLGACGAPAGSVRPVELRGRTMGTTYTLKLIPPAHGLDAIALQRDVAALFAQVEARLSVWREDSELSRFHAWDEAGWFPVSAETCAVVAAALAMRDASGGAFDPGVAALTDLWGFGPNSRGRRVPPAARVHARRPVGGHAVEVRRRPPALRKRRPGVCIELSAVAQGHALDALDALLSGRGSAHHLLEVGGELRARGRVVAAAPWRVAVEVPGSLGRDVLEVVALEDAAISTSGIHVQRFEEGGRWYSHILDPRTGRPVAHALAAVSVIAPSAMEADAAATALMVLGPEAGPRLARARGWAALFVTQGNDGFPCECTPAFEAHRAIREEA